MPDRSQAPVSATVGAARVDDVMSAPIVTCQADVPLNEVAELMARHRIHAVVVLGEPDASGNDPRPWGVISDADLVRAVAFGAEATTAGRVAASPVVTVTHDSPLLHAAQLMSDHETTHVLALEHGHPVGVVSALDVAARLAAPSDAPAEGSARPATEPTEVGLHAVPGDRLVIHGHHLGEAGRDAEILEARGSGGGVPFLVRWQDNGHVTLLYPGSDAHVEHLGD
jgi:CBS domain-containing protein